MTWQMTVGLVTLALLVLPGAAAAQDVATSLDELVRSGELGPGDGVYVTDAAGRRIKGRISDMSPSMLEFTDGRDTWTLAANEVSKIELQDPVDTGIVIGIGAGLLSWVGIAAAVVASAVKAISSSTRPSR